MVVIEDILILGTFISLQLMVLFFVFYLLRKRQLWPLIRAGLSGHGTLVQKILPDGGVSFYYSGKAVERVLWKFKDSKGKLKKVFTPIEGIKHHLAGSAIPLHICPHNAGSNISILKEKDKELTAKEINEITMFAYDQGVIDARKMMMPKAGLNFDWKLIMIIGIVALVAWFMWPSLQAQFGGAV